MYSAGPSTIFYQVSELDRQLGNNAAREAALRICNSICSSSSLIVQLACAIEAFEEEDYNDWPRVWTLSAEFLITLIEEYEFAMNMDRERPHRFLMRQRMSYALLNQTVSVNVLQAAEDKEIILQW